MLIHGNSGYVRRAQARLELGFEDRALEDLEKAHQLDPKQNEIAVMIQNAKKRVEALKDNNMAPI